MRNFSEKFYRPESFPIAFQYDGEEYHGFPSEKFVFLNETKSVDEKKETVKTRLSLKDQLTFEIIRVYYPKYDFYEWSISLENTSEKRSGVLSDLRAELSLECERPVLKGILGDHVNYYSPYAKELEKEDVSFVSDGGRPTHIYFPYFNLTCEGGGAFLVIGWGGTWSARFRYADGAVNFSGRSIISLNTFLDPGDKVCSATFICGFYKGDYYDSVNHWRRWYMENNMPAFDKDTPEMRPFSDYLFRRDAPPIPGAQASINETYQTWRPTFDKMQELGFKPDFRWFDAGWYVGPDGKDIGTDWEATGSWEFSPVKWPGNTFAEATEFLHRHGMRTFFWMEPERIKRPDLLEKNFGYNQEWAIEVDGLVNVYNNIGIPACYEWTKNKLCKILKDNKIDVYREDFNMQPGPYWDYWDQMDGKYGMTEHNAVMAHYKLWDEIIECTSSYGGCCFVDSCASGGGRNDLLSMRRAVPILRSDNDRETTAIRLSMTTSFDEWIPCTGANTKEKPEQTSAIGNTDVYIWRASYLPILNVDMQFVLDPDQDFSILINGMAEWQKVNPYLLKDFYVLTPWHSRNDKKGFTSYCYYDPEKDKGVLFVFRMEECEEDSVRIKLPFAKDGVGYTLTDEDSDEKRILLGEECLCGFDVSVAEKRQAKLIWVEKNK